MWRLFELPFRLIARNAGELWLVAELRFFRLCCGVWAWCWIFWTGNLTYWVRWAMSDMLFCFCTRTGVSFEIKSISKITIHCVDTHFTLDHFIAWRKSHKFVITLEKLIACYIIDAIRSCLPHEWNIIFFFFLPWKKEKQDRQTLELQTLSKACLNLLRGLLAIWKLLAGIRETLTDGFFSESSVIQRQYVCVNERGEEEASQEQMHRTMARMNLSDLSRAGNSQDHRSANSPFSFLLLTGGRWLFNAD